MMETISYLISHADLFLEATIEHAALVASTLLIASAAAAAITLACLQSRRAANAAVELLGAFYSIPSIALFALLIPLTGLGEKTAVIVMVAYCQFILVRNALEGLNGIDPAITEASRGLGMTPAQTLLRVRLPLAAPAIIAGLRMAAISCVGIATVAATINAGGLGSILFSGLRTLNVPKILGGTLCCVLLALAFDALLRAVEKLTSARTGMH